MINYVHNVSLRKDKKTFLDFLKGMQKEVAMAFVKIFTPDSNWTWYITERDPDTNECFGVVCGLEREYGYFNLEELQGLRGPLGLPLERDRYFEPMPVNLCK
jgi:hypothetical protein